MTLDDLLRTLDERGIQVLGVGDRLRYFPREAVTPDLLDALLAHKANLLVMFRWPAMPWPIVNGTEHFNLYVDDPAGPWPEFIPGRHFDIRQSSRLRGIHAPRDQRGQQ